MSLSLQIPPFADALLLSARWPTCGYFVASLSLADASLPCAFIVDTLSLLSSPP